MTATFFNAKYIKHTLVEGTRVMLSGEVGFFKGTMQLTHPAFLILDSPTGRTGGGTKSLKKMIEATQDADGEFDISVFERDFFPIYPASAKLQSWDIYACVRQVLAVLDPVADPLPESILRATQSDVRGRGAACGAPRRECRRAGARASSGCASTRPSGCSGRWSARRYGELSETGPPAPPREDGLRAALLDRLPFELTGGQHEVLAVISAELAASRPMNRMLQGEVGSGKTVVALLAMLQMVDAGYQCAMLAPTEVLADQHARSIRDVLGPLALAGQLGGSDDATRVALLTGSMSPAQKRRCAPRSPPVQAGIVIGTHALIQEAVEFHQLGMVVVDEQHRFGVEQRDQLRAKAKGGITPHLLVMTATPIPRTVALTVYGDLETSTLRELPRGRQPIATSVVFATQKPDWLERAWQRIREEVAAGRQVYVVAPRIDDDDKPAATDGDGGPPRKATSVVELFNGLRTSQLAGLRLGLMHGRLAREEKDAVMAGFRAGDIDVLVCTTVIEVGVDVPNATVMVVMDADWFGISQLHQLRGRIGRGEHPSLCLLVTTLPRESKAGERLKAVASRWTGSNSPTSTSPSAVRAMCWAATSPGGPSPCGCCRWGSTARSSKRRGPSASRPTNAIRATPDWRCWPPTSPTASASSTWTSRETQHADLVGRRGAARRDRGRPDDGGRGGPRAFIAAADVPTVAPGVDVLAGIPVVPLRIRGFDYRRAAFGDAWDDDNDAPGGHNGCDTRNDILDRDLVDKTFVAIKRCPDGDRHRHTARPVHQRDGPVRPRQPDRRLGADRPHRPAGTGLGHGCPVLDRRDAAALRQRPGEPDRRGRKSQPGQERSRAGHLDAAQRGVLVPVLDAVHRGGAGVQPARRCGVGGAAAAGRGNVSDGLTSALSRLHSCRCSLSPCGPRIMRASTGPSDAPNECGVQVLNSTASPASMVKSRSPRTSRMRPDSTYIQSSVVHGKFRGRRAPARADADLERVQPAAGPLRVSGQEVMPSGCARAVHPRVGLLRFAQETSMLTDSAAARRGRWSRASRRLPDPAGSTSRRRSAPGWPRPAG